MKRISTKIATVNRRPATHNASGMCYVQAINHGVVGRVNTRCIRAPFEVPKLLENRAILMCGVFSGRTSFSSKVPPYVKHSVLTIFLYLPQLTQMVLRPSVSI